MESQAESQTRSLARVGVASAGVGLAQLVATKVAAARARADSSRASTLLTAVGARALGHSVAELVRPSRSTWTTRVRNAVGVATLRRALEHRSGERRRRRRTAVAAGAVGLGAVGAVTAARSRSQRDGERPGPQEVTASVTVNKGPDEVYAFWRDFTQLPHFMHHLQSVTANNDGSWHWVANAPVKRSVAWDADVTVDEPGQRISWKSRPGADVDNSGTVHFAAAPGDRGTEVRVSLQYGMPAGKVGAIVARLLGEQPQQQVDDDLRRFKQVLETGQVVRSDRSPSGTAARQQTRQRPAQPVPDDHGASA